MNNILIIVIVVWVLSTTTFITTSQNGDKIDHIVETLKCPVNQLEINTANRKAFFDMENDPLPEYAQSRIQ